MFSATSVHVVDGLTWSCQVLSLDFLTIDLAGTAEMQLAKVWKLSAIVDVVTIGKPD